uniref:Alternative protein PSAP n=1 Tax=Homo sapiens TaxID=9606 RepID=L8EA14_HUMAN|nr:alternative protein PSAP [Homo sapiens]
MLSSIANAMCGTRRRNIPSWQKPQHWFFSTCVSGGMNAQICLTLL